MRVTLTTPPMGMCAWGGSQEGPGRELWACPGMAVELVQPVLKGGDRADVRPYCARHGELRRQMNTVALAGGDPAMVPAIEEHVPGSEDPTAFDDPEAAARSLAVFAPQEGDDIRIMVGHFRKPLRRALANSLRVIFAGFECDWSTLEKRLCGEGQACARPGCIGVHPDSLLSEVKGMVDAQLVKVVEAIGAVL